MQRFLHVSAWAIIAISSAVFFGNIAEVCDRLGRSSLSDSIDTCPSRLEWLIACGVVASLLALVMLVLSLAFSKMSPFPLIELIVSLFLVAWLSAGAGVASSVRTAGSTQLSKGFAFLALFTSLLLFINSLLKCMDRSSSAGATSEGRSRDLEKAKRDPEAVPDHADAGVPLSNTS